MKSPRVLICATDDWLMSQLREAIADRRWLLARVSINGGWRGEAHGGPRVVVAQADPVSDDTDTLRMIGEVSRSQPETDIVVVCDVKLNDEDRPKWTATVMDLGARLVLYPPLTRTVLEDAVIGLMEGKTGSTPVPSRMDAIDLAAGDFEAS